MKPLKFRYRWALAATLVLVGAETMTGQRQETVDWVGLRLTLGQPALAARSGGRSGGGSFRSRPSRSSGEASGASGGSSDRDNSSARSPDRPAYDNQPYDRSYNGGYYNRGPVIVPVPIPGGGYSQPYPQGNPNFNNPYPAPVDPNATPTISPTAPTNTLPQAVPSPSPTASPTPANAGPSGMDMFLGLLLLGAGTILPVGMLIWLMKRFGQRKGSKDELTNDIVTVSQVQVALLAQARSIQTALADLSMQVDTTTPTGLLQLLQEAALALLRSPENWSHVLGRSQTLPNLDAAEGMFNQVAIAERSKYTVETLTNVGGRVKRSTNYEVDPDKDPASYIVVTLLVGSTHDQPLFSEVRTTAQLKEVLQKLAAMPSEQLLVFELLWTPQVESDSLTYDELLTEYTDMVQI